MLEKLKDELHIHAVQIDGVTYRVSRCEAGECPFASLKTGKAKAECLYPGGSADRTEPGDFPSQCPLKNNISYKLVDRVRHLPGTGKED